MSYLFHLLTYFSIYVVIALSLNIVIGYCGLLTLAHACYFAIGSYVYALVSLKLGWGFFPAMVAGIIVASLMSLAVSVPAWRLKGVFFLMLTLAVQALLFSTFNNWSSSEAKLGSWGNLTNGPFGIAAIPKPDIFGIKLATLGSLAAFSVFLAIVCAIICWRLLDSPWGRLLKAQRDDELAARGLGKQVRRAKVQAFAIACGMVAAAGSFYAAYVSFIDPGAASLSESILMLCMVIVGGVGNFRGPIVGALVLLLIPEALRFANIPDAVAGNLRQLVYGLLLVLVVRFRPQGIAGEYRID